DGLPRHYPVGPPVIAAAVPIAITPITFSSFRPAYTPPNARITSPGMTSPRKIDRSNRTATATIGYPADEKIGPTHRMICLTTPSTITGRSSPRGGASPDHRG